MHLAVVRTALGDYAAARSEAERALARDFVRIPMAADQPSINLAQATQLLAYECAIALGRDVDQPRNLAKSVTVE